MSRERIIALLLAVGALALILAAPAGADWTQPPVRTSAQHTAHEIAESLRRMGYQDDHPVIRACQDWWQAEEAAASSAAAYVTKAQKSAHPEAAYVWQLLKQAGLSDIHAAAILGNAMAESGGHTLDIDVYQDVGGYWGAWAMSKVYYPDVAGQGADAQVQKILDTLGPGFYETTDVRTAAKWFSDNWERPAAWASIRADNAEAALAYFGGGGDG